jgi:hypothetical protein
MSRSYVYRHGWGKRPDGVNYTVARMRARDRALEEEMSRHIAHDVYDYSCIVGLGVWRTHTWIDNHQRRTRTRWYEFTSHEDCLPCRGYYRRGDQVKLAMRNQTKTQNHWDLPHTGYGAQFSGAKKWHRTEGNRRGRHDDKQKLHKLLGHGTRELKDAYAIFEDYCGDESCTDCGTYFITGAAAAKDLEQELSRKHTNWDNWSLT